jgi:hypothetical protein
MLKDWSENDEKFENLYPSTNRIFIVYAFVFRFFDIVFKKHGESE